MYEVKERAFAPIKVMSVRVVVPFNNISQVMDDAFTKLYGYIAKMGKPRPPIPPFSLYHAENCTMEQLDIEVCEPVNELMPGEGDIVGRTVDGVSNLMVSYVHKGPYETLGEVYPAMMLWAEENDYEWNTDFPMREIYLNNPTAVAPQDLLTEIVWSVRRNET